MIVTKHFKERLKEREIENIDLNEVMEKGFKCKRNKNIVLIRYDLKVSKNRSKEIFFVFDEERKLFITAYVNRNINEKKFQKRMARTKKGKYGRKSYLLDEIKYMESMQEKKEHGI